MSAPPATVPHSSPRRAPSAAPHCEEINLEAEAVSRKRLRVCPSVFDDVNTLKGLLLAALPDKTHFFDDWLKVLASPAVCITSLDDVRRLALEDISGLPVPALVKGVLRDVLAREVERMKEQTAVLQATAARARAFLAPLRDRNMQPPMAGSKYFQDQKNYRLILTHEEMEAGVRIVARRIETWSRGDRIVLVAILKGAFMFLSDLCRALVRPYSVYFVEASSYKEKRSQGGAVEISSDLASAKFCDTVTKAPHKVVLVDELLDNGKTMQEMKQHLLKALSATHTEDDILTCCLLSKKRPRDFPEADIVGIPDLPDLWLVGYGLDDRGTKRGWAELFAIPKVKIVETLDREEVQKLLSVLDNDCVVTSPMIFAGFELTSNHKQKYRLHGLDAASEGRDLVPKAAGVYGLKEGLSKRRKADVETYLSRLPTVKGKFEHELQFAFIQENVHLCAEDEIFSGNLQVYAEMRCRLRKQIAGAARRFQVEGF